jgi:hypothetical protein
LPDLRTLHINTSWRRIVETYDEQVKIHDIVRPEFNNHTVGKRILWSHSIAVVIARIRETSQSKDNNPCKTSLRDIGSHRPLPREITSVALGNVRTTA